ncbi:ribosomal protection-like ABC-F family protein [Paenibacillus sp. MMS20-IR301]|uniref:ribosomal protection-like ABC-F family protein n=1 Tax=Paenibacillus sp. MMS20-IR301 TaxID=2895946 RepID=UPI0028E8A0CF|nr:ABC-F family ATP-binding cassette domain-containing protein [Paenibacillus sp. MMS20-IR301]WNS40894.1 ABC-F family ATP-binding cassette domain-containing protein [Paenibacillus sp. MMS20-IR301]
MIISCQNVQKYHGAQLVLENITFEIRQGEKIGLIGRNGCGKTTLFHLLSGEERPDQGQISIRRGSVIGLLAQIQEAHDSETVYDVLQRSFAEPLAWQRRLRELEQEMSAPGAEADEAGWGSLLKEYGTLQEKFEAAGGYEIESSIQRVAAGLGIGAHQYDRRFATLSGGEKTKIGLAELLLRRPDILLLDEPTNHLDMEAIEWLEQFLQSYDGTVLAISHDRYFLDAVVKKVIEIEDGEAFTFHANYSGYQIEKEARLLQQFADYQEQQKKIKQMQESIKRLIEWGKLNPQNVSFPRRAASMQKALDRMVKVKRPVLERKSMDLQLQQDDRTGNQVVILEQISKAYGDRKLFSTASDILRYGETTALIGGNGAGKSTLLRIILGQETPDSGSCTLAARAVVGYLAQEAVPEENGQSVLRYFREEAGLEEGEARGQLARFLFYGSDVFKDITNLSGGEWTRLRFAVLMHRRPNLLILDEPTNHLDIDSREALEEALEEFPGTVLAVSHDRYFINRCFGKLWTIEGGRFSSFSGNYEYYKEKQAGAAVQPSAAGKPAGRADIPFKAKASPAANGVRSRSSEHSASGAASRKPRPAAAWEQDIAAAEARLASIDAEMLDPQHASDALKLAGLQETRDGAQQQLDDLYSSWLSEADK